MELYYLNMEYYTNKDLPEISEEELIAGMKTSENSIFLKILYERFYDLVFGSCLSILKDLTLAEEAASVTFEVIITKVKNYEINSLASWIYVIARNTCNNYFREKARNRNFQSLTGYEVREPVVEPEYFVHQKTTEREKVEKALLESLDKINILQAKCLKLFYFEKKSYAQISRELKIELSDVKSHLQNGKRALYLVMKKHL